jgi:hypothetical protein
MSAVPGYFMNEKPEPREPQDPDESQVSEGDREDPDDSMAAFWQWFALAILLFAWIAEATMCADRGF